MSSRLQKQIERSWRDHAPEVVAQSEHPCEYCVKGCNCAYECNCGPDCLCPECPGGQAHLMAPQREYVHGNRKVTIPPHAFPHNVASTVAPTKCDATDTSLESAAAKVHHRRLEDKHPKLPSMK